MHELVQNLKTVEHYKQFVRDSYRLTEVERQELWRWLGRRDLFFLLAFLCGRKDVARPWLLDRCKEVQAAPNGFLDLWSREHYKSTIITFAQSIQDILSSHGDNPHPKWGGREVTIGIFSCTRPIAKGFLGQIKYELEHNENLRTLYPDILWENPNKDAPRWSMDNGIVVQRKTNPKESTVEAWGVIDGQPTSRHFYILVYDDLVTVDHVGTPTMMQKVLSTWEVSTNLGAEGGIQRYIGTRYHANDAYRHMLKRKVAVPRIYAATKDGSVEGEPVLLSREALDEKRKIQGPYTFACQMLLDPVADETQGFKREWVCYHKGSNGDGMNKYILVDPANEKKQTNDYTVMAVIGLGPDKNYYLLDLVRDRLNLAERADMLFRLHGKWQPITVGYEKYGMQADVEHFKYEMSHRNYHFSITELGGRLNKLDRIRSLIPIFAGKRFYLPESLFKTNYEKKTEDLVDVFLAEEYDSFPVSMHDDMLDAIARIMDEDLGAVWPRIIDDKPKERYRHRRRGGGASSWAV